MKERGEPRRLGCETQENVMSIYLPLCLQLNQTKVKAKRREKCISDGQYKEYWDPVTKL